MLHAWNASPAGTGTDAERYSLVAMLLRQISEQRQHVIDRGPDIAQRYALVEPVAESIAVFYEKRAHSIAEDVLIANHMLSLAPADIVGNTAAYHGTVQIVPSVPAVRAVT